MTNDMVLMVQKSGKLASWRLVYFCPIKKTGFQIHPKTLVGLGSISAINYVA